MTYTQAEIDRLADAMTEYAAEAHGASHRQTWAANQIAERFGKRSPAPKNLVIAWAEETREFVLNGSNWRFSGVLDRIIAKERAAA